MFKLTAQIIGDAVVGVDIPELPKGYNPKDPESVPFKIELTPSTAFADISSIDNWYKYGIQKDYFKYDYLFFRDRIKEIVAARARETCILLVASDQGLKPNKRDRFLIIKGEDGFKNKDGLIAEWDEDKWIFHDPESLGYKMCSDIEKRILMELYVGNGDDHDRDFGYAAAQDCRTRYHEQSKAVREKRLEYAESFVESHLKQYQSPILLMLTSLTIPLNIGFGQQMFNMDSHNNYRKFGIKGTLEDYNALKNPQPATGIMDYIYGRSFYTGMGLINMPWQPDNMTMQQACDRLRDILVLGLI
ncbi:MAG: hypothetical protein ACRC8K_09410 [Waterburya sp.]